MKKFSVKSTALFIVFSLLFSLSCFGDNPNFKSASSRAKRWTNYSTWMEDSWNTLKDQRYCDIVLFGTHDSQTYGLRYYNRSQIAKKLSPTADKIAKVPIVKNILDSILKKITLPKSITQDVNIYTQLHEGSRFLDIRFKPLRNDGKIRAFHGMFGDTIQEVAYQIKDFIKETDKEIIFINFNRYGEMWDVDTKTKESIGKAFQSILGEYIFTQDEFSFTKSLSELQSTGKRIVLNTNTGGYDKYLTTSIKPGYEVPQAQYGSQNLRDVVIPKLNEKYSSQYKNTKDKNKLNQWYQIKLQLSMTPEETFNPVLNALKKVDLIGSLKKLNRTIPESLRDLTIPYRADIDHMMKNLGSGANDNQPNIWFRDFYDKREVAHAIGRNFGKTPDERIQSLKHLFSESKKNNSLRSEFNLLKDILRITGELPPEFADKRDIFTTPSVGGIGGHPFVLHHEGSTSNPTKIGIRSGSSIDALEISYGRDTLKTGGRGGNYKSLSLGKDEYIIYVEVGSRNHGDHAKEVNYIKLKTNKNRTITTGNASNCSIFKYHLPSGWVLKGFIGRSADRIDALSVVAGPK